MQFSYLDIGLMERICHKMAVKIFDTQDDPIAEFDDHDFAKLDAALNNPKQTFDGKDLYPTLPEKATILWYSLNKNHPFSNGNKRISTMSFLVFLSINNHWVKTSKKELLEKAILIAKSNPSDHDKILDELNDWTRKNLESD